MRLSKSLPVILSIALCSQAQAQQHSRGLFTQDTLSEYNFEEELAQSPPTIPKHFDVSEANIKTPEQNPGSRAELGKDFLWAIVMGGAVVFAVML
jgi:hypothetical protein